eukprot:UN14764
MESEFFSCGKRSFNRNVKRSRGPAGNKASDHSQANTLNINVLKQRCLSG